MDNVGWNGAPEVNELRLGPKRSWEKDSLQYMVFATAPHWEPGQGESSIASYLWLEKMRTEKNSEHLNMKSIHRALFHHKKNMYPERRFENHRLLGFEANVHLRPAEGHSCSINFQEVD